MSRGKQIKIKKVKKMCNVKNACFIAQSAHIIPIMGKLNDDMIEKISRYVGEGLFYQQAADIVGVDRITIYTWKRKGKEDISNGNSDTLHAKLAIALKKAESERELACIAKIREDESWQSKAWLLERRYSERWVKRDHIQVEHGVKRDDAKVLRGILGNMTDEDFQHALEQAGIESE